MKYKENKIQNGQHTRGKRQFRLNTKRLNANMTTYKVMKYR